jgi:rhamnosyltransferase
VNYSIGFVIYLPDESLLKRLKAASEKGYRIYIYDNSPDIATVRNYSKELSNCRYMTCGKNVGLGFGISSICAQAYYEGNDALLFFDQDTEYNEKTLNYISDFLEYWKLEFKTYAAIQFSGNSRDQHLKLDDYSFFDINLTISSGSLYNLNNLYRINWHNVSYFVDGVDYEFSLRSSFNNLKLGNSPYTPGFDHVSGQADKPYDVLGKRYYLREYGFRRIQDILMSYLRLFVTSLIYRRFWYTKIFFRSFLIFWFYQIIVRILNTIKKNERDNRN